MQTETDICLICHRPLNKSWDEHHLIPKTFKGKETIRIHKICHNKIHSVFTERELYQRYHTVERLLENEYIKKFVKWIKNKDPDFYEKTKDTKNRKRRRRR